MVKTHLQAEALLVGSCLTGYHIRLVATAFSPASSLGLLIPTMGGCCHRCTCGVMLEFSRILTLNDMVIKLSNGSVGSSLLSLLLTVPEYFYSFRFNESQ